MTEATHHEITVHSVNIVQYHNVETIICVKEFFSVHLYVNAIEQNVLHVSLLSNTCIVVFNDLFVGIPT